MPVSLLKPDRPCNAVMTRVGVLGSPAICTLPDGHDDAHACETGFCGGVVVWTTSTDVRFVEDTGRTFLLPRTGKPTPVCGAVHPVALHDDDADIMCTLPEAHTGDHQDHSTVETTSAVVCWEA